MLRSFVLILMGLGAAAPLSAQQPTVTLVDFGVLCDVFPSGQREAPLTESGQMNLIDQDQAIDVISAAVPARLGLSFGIRVLLADEASSTGTRIVVTHPPLGRKGVTVQSWAAPLTPGEPNLNLFTFEHGYELVQGRWSFAVMDDTGLLLEQSFEVLPGVSVPQVQEVCFQSLPMS